MTQAMSPQDELAGWHQCVAHVQRQMQGPLTAAQRAQCEQYLSTARARMAQLQSAGVVAGRRELPMALTPSQGVKAARKLEKAKKREEKRNKKLRRYANTAIAELPESSPLRAVAATVMDETKDKEKRKDALHTLLDNVPLKMKGSTVVKVLAKEVMDDWVDERDDDEDD